MKRVLTPVVFSLFILGMSHTALVQAVIYSSSYSYDVPNGKTTKTDPNGKRIQYTYNAVNNLSEIKLLDAAGLPTFNYYYGLTNKLERMTYPDGEQTFGYDVFDRVESITDFDQANPMLAFDYDHKDRITWVTYPDASDVCYEYDPDGRITRVGRVLPGNRVEICNDADEKTDFNYDVKGRIETVDYPNGVQKFHEYSLITGQTTVVGYRRQPSGALIYSDTFKYFPNSTLYFSITHTTTVDSKATYYEYDAYDRLEVVLEANGRRSKFEYDAFGNRTRENITNINDANATEGTAKAYGDYAYEYPVTGNRLSRILKDGVVLESFVYDDAGRMTQRTHTTKGITGYTYDDRGLLTKVTQSGMVVDYTYDALDVRKSKTVNGVKTQYLTANIFGFSRVLMELDENLNIKSTYTYAGHLPLKEEPVEADRTQDLYYLHSGIVGSVSHALDSNGVIKNEYAYDAFGARSEMSADGASHKRYGYTGEHYDDETGLLYLRARYYDPELGRFISADPYWGRLEEPVTQNRFIYVQNNPLIYSDPSGLRPVSSCEMGWSCKEPLVDGPRQPVDAYLRDNLVAGVGLASAITGILVPPLIPLTAIVGVTTSTYGAYAYIEQDNYIEAGLQILPVPLNTLPMLSLLVESFNFSRGINVDGPIDNKFKFQDEFGCF